MVAPQSMPTIGTRDSDQKELGWVETTEGVLYCAGVQNGFIAIAYRVPMIEMGIVEPSIAMRTEGNCRDV